MDRKQELEQRIVKLHQRIDELRKILVGDTWASLKESAQTTEMIQSHERQISNLKEEIANLDGSVVVYHLQKNDGTELEFSLVEKGADPFSRRVTRESPLGEQLSTSEVGTIVTIGADEYQISRITYS